MSRPPRADREAMCADAAGRVRLGVVTAAHGIRGEVAIRTFTGSPEAIAGYGPLVSEDGARTFVIERLRPARGGVIAKLRGIDDRDAAQALEGTALLVPRDRLPPTGDEDEFYHADLIGLAVERSGGGRLGTVVAVQSFGAGDLIEIRLAGAERTVYLPFTRAVVPVVDVAAGRIVVDPPDGLIEEESG